MSEPELEEQFRQALVKRDAGEMTEAQALLEKLAAAFPEWAAIWGALGGVYFEQSAWADAAVAFRRATELSPKSELSSVSYFHSLLRLGRGDEAFAEADRFLALVPESFEYRLVKRDLAEEGKLHRWPKRK